MSRSARLGLTTFTLFIWVNLIPSIYPIPWQISQEIHETAVWSADNAAKFRAAGGESGAELNWSVADWEKRLFTERAFWWMLSLVMLLTGIAASVAIALDSRLWPKLVITAAGTIFLVSTSLTLYGTFSAGAELSMRTWANLVVSYLPCPPPYSVLQSLYNVFIWPVLCLLLAIFAITRLRAHETKSAT